MNPLDRVMANIMTRYRDDMAESFPAAATTTPVLDAPSDDGSFCSCGIPRAECTCMEAV